MSISGYTSSNYALNYENGTLTVGPVNVDGKTITYAYTDVHTYAGYALTPSTIVTVDGVQLTGGVDFYSTYENNITVTTSAKITIN